MKNKNLILMVIAIILMTQNSFCQKNDLKSNFSSNIIQMGIVAYDFDETLNFYKNVIGMTEMSKFSVPAAFSKNSGLANGIPFNVTVLQLNQNTESSIIKIMSFKNKPKIKKNDFIQNGFGVRYITIHFKSLKSVKENLKKNHIKFLGQTPISMGNGNGFILIKDPNGIFIELIGKE